MSEFQTLLDLIKQQGEFSAGLHGALDSLGKVVLGDREVLGNVIKLVEKQNDVLKYLVDAVGKLNGEDTPKIEVPQIPEGWGVISDQ